MIHFELFEHYDLEDADPKPSYAQLASKFGLAATDVTNCWVIHMRLESTIAVPEECAHGVVAVHGYDIDSSVSIEVAHRDRGRILSRDQIISRRAVGAARIPGAGNAGAQSAPFSSPAKRLGGELPLAPPSPSPY